MNDEATHFTHGLVVTNLCTGSKIYLHGKSVRSWCDGSSDRSFMVDPLGSFSFQPVPHECYNKGRGMWYPVGRMMHIKEPLRVSSLPI